MDGAVKMLTAGGGGESRRHSGANALPKVELAEARLQQRAAWLARSRVALGVPAREVATAVTQVGHKVQKTGVCGTRGEQPESHHIPARERTPKGSRGKRTSGIRGADCRGHLLRMQGEGRPPGGGGRKGPQEQTRCQSLERGRRGHCLAPRLSDQAVRVMPDQAQTQKWLPSAPIERVT